MSEKPTLKDAVVQRLQVIEKRNNIAGNFQDAGTLLASIARRDDFFSGYTLREAIMDRLAQIGYETDVGDENYDYPGDSEENEFYGAETRFGPRTIDSELGRLNALKKRVEQAVEQGVALLEAETVEAAQKLSSASKLNGEDPIDATETK